MFFTYIKRTSRYQYGDFLFIAEITDGTDFESSAATKWVSVKLHDRWQLQRITRTSYCCFPTLLDQRDKSEQAENNKRSLYNTTQQHMFNILTQFASCLLFAILNLKSDTTNRHLVTKIKTKIKQ